MRMADSVQGEGSNAGGSGELERRPSVAARARAGIARALAALNGPSSPRARRRPAYIQAYKDARDAYAHARGYDYALMYANVRAYVSLAVKASGLVALLLSTVILLGGYVQSLVKQDFFCIMVITVIQAAGIFQDWENNVQYLNNFGQTLMVPLAKLNLIMYIRIMGIPLIYISAPVLVLALCIHLFYLFGPLACAAISSWRIADFNHANNRDGTDSTADMVAAVNIFYSLIIFQGTMFLVLLLFMSIYRAIVARYLDSLEQLSDNKWGKDAIRRYISDITWKCRKDPLSIRGMDLMKYAAELLDSESQEDYLYGTRLLSAYIEKGKDISWALLSSSHKIQKLVDSLWIGSGTLDGSTEIRELAATIVADLAGHIDVARYPGAMRYISSLLQEETTQTYWNSSKEASDPRRFERLGLFEILFQSNEKRMKNPTRREEEREWRLMRDQKRLGISQERQQQKNKGVTSNKLVQQGLTILERLASNNDNRRLICSTPGLLTKITAPVYSESLIQDVKTKAWADIVTRCLKVLYQLIRVPDGCNEIFSDNVQALSNLKSILELGNNEADHQELQLVAMEILTELSLDLSINLTVDIKKELIKEQLELFLHANGDVEESAVIAGKAMVSLSTNSESNSALIMTAQDDIIGRLTGIILDDNKNSITQRTIAAEIMANLCAHCNVDNIKDILPKVLREIIPIGKKSQERKNSEGQNNPASGDEENQGESSVSTNNEEGHDIFMALRLVWSRLAALGKQSPSKIEEISDEEREEQEAFLSLALVICDKLESADLDGAIQNSVHNENNAGSGQRRRETFVDKLKTIIDDITIDNIVDGNCHPAPPTGSLRIVKLCGLIAISVMRSEQYVEIFRNKGFKSSLSKASETMSQLESCMLFVGTDFGPKKTVRPLFSKIEETLSEILANKP